MPPRKAPVGGSKAKAKAKAKAASSKSKSNDHNTSDTNSNDESMSVDDDPSVTTVPAAVPMTPRAAAGGRTNTRAVFTPVAGARKYARGTADPVAATPQQRAALDVMRVAVARTPYTARRGIAEYEAERDPIRTFLRLKPAGQDMCTDGNRPQCLVQLASEKEVEVVRPGSSSGVRERYLFAGVLPSLARQPRVFEACALPVVRDLFQGFNTLLFSYGVSNSGKTHTVQGSGDSPGMLPRSVLAVLGVLDACKAQGDFAVRPRYATQVEYCSDARVTRPVFRVAPGEDAWVAGLSREDPALDPRVAEIAQEVAGGAGEWAYQLYVSYFEVYNEMVYDLLDLTTLTTVRVGDAPQPQPQPRARGKRATRRKQEDAPDLVNMSAAQIAALPRAALLLRSEGGRGNEAFVEGATEVRVRGARDLVRVLVHGQLRRAVHATGLNAGSSRSHAVFQAKLVKIRRAATVDPLDGVSAGARASVRTMTVVDLAGSERAKRTHTQGERLAEAGKINVGLMTLKKCLDVKRFNAGLPDGDPGVQLVPYNESKVTRLFQPALEGGARTCMVVCVDPYEHVGAEPGAAYAEIKGVLEFARVASELVTQVRRVEDPAEVLSESPTGVRAGAAGADSDDDEEVFFDSKGLRASALPMPPPPLVLKRSNAVANARAAAEAEADPAKRQRRDMAGSWQPPPSPSPAMARAMLQATERRAPVATPQRSRPTPAVLEPGSANPMPVPTSVWESITRNSPFSFDLPPSRVHREAPLLLSQTFAMHSEQKREITYLREALARAQTQISAGQTHAEVDELVAYADALERTLGQVRLRYGALQERAVCVEEETRAEVSRFFLAKVAELKQAAGERLRDEVARCEVKAAHKIDILSRLRSARGSQSDSDSDDGQGAGVDAAQVPTVSPRSAVRRAVSRAASKKANKLASVSAGENAELHNLRSTVESLESRMSALSTELELAGQKRDAEREIRATLEVAVAEANAEVAALAAQNKAILAQPQQSGNAQMAVTLVHERERAELLAQITMLKTQLKEADTQAKYARRLWEVQEMLPMQERLRVVKETRGRGGTGADDSAGIADASSVARLQVELDQVWEWFTQEQQKNTELSARFDVLVRKTRKNLAERQILQQQQREEEGEDGEGQAGSDGQMDSDDGSFHMVSLTSAEAISAINGGNPLGVSTLPVAVPGAAGATSQASFATNSTQALSRVMSKSRVLHHRGQSKSQQQIMTRDSSDSFTHHTAAGTLSTAASAQAGGRQHAKLEGAKRVVSRVFNHFTPEAKRRGGGGDGSVLPYMAGRYAHTDTAVGSYSAEVVSFEQGGAGLGLRPRGDTMGAEARQDKVRSIVYSGPIVAHPTGGVSVTFTSEEVHDLPFVAEADDEDYEDEDEDMEIMDITSANGDEDTGSAQGTKRSRSMMRRPPALLPSVDVEYEEQPVVDHGDAAAAAAARSYNSENARQNHRSVSSSHPPFTEVPLRGYQSPTDSIVTTADVSSSSVTRAPAPATITTTITAAATAAAAVKKKKRRLHAGRTVMNVVSPDSDDNVSMHMSLSSTSLMGTPSKLVGAWPPQHSPLLGGGHDLKSGSTTAAVAVVSRQPVLFTPVRSARSRDSVMEAGGSSSGMDSEEKGGEQRSDNIFMTPIKMLSRLRNRKK